MKWAWVLLLNVTFVSGCNTFTDAQLRLVEQAKKGLELESSAAQQRAEFVQNYYSLQRGRLDTAFDADVRETPQLSIDWIIEHRKAYAAAIDAINQRAANAKAAEATSAQNRVAFEAALQRLSALISIFQRGKDVFDQSQR